MANFHGQNILETNSFSSFIFLLGDFVLFQHFMSNFANETLPLLEPRFLANFHCQDLLETSFFPLESRDLLQYLYTSISLLFYEKFEKNVNEHL